jgi:hypothetical protein
MASCSQLGPAWLTVMCNAGSSTARWAGETPEARSGSVSARQGYPLCGGGGGGGLGGLGGGGFGGLAGSMEHLNSTHSITSSASNCIELGTARPKVFAVLKLITNSNLVDRCMGRSAGFSPLTIRPV